MTLSTDLTAAVALVVADSALFNNWLHGPASGAGSIVDFGGGLTVKTPARIAAENAVFETVQPLSIASGAVAIDISQAGVFTLALTANVTSIAITGAQANKATSFILETTADGTQRTIAQPGSVVAMSGDFVPSATNAKKDRLLYDTINGGTTWRQWILAQNFT